jgi:hypothetical protein
MPFGMVDLYQNLQTEERPVVKNQFAFVLVSEEEYLVDTETP